MRVSWRLRSDHPLPLPVEDAIVLFESRDGILQSSVCGLEPQLGLNTLRYQSRPLQGWRILAPALAGSEQAPTLLDYYVRGDDVVATYEHPDAGSVRLQVYWRSIAPGSSAPRHGVELIASVQTSSLQADPQITVASQFPNVEILKMQRESGFRPLELGTEAVGRSQCDGLGVFVIRPAACDFSYVEMVYPSDFRGAHLSRLREDDAAQLIHNLFPEPLEKGVIRRGRVRGWFVEREGDLTTAAELYRAWESELPPLTT